MVSTMSDPNSPYRPGDQECNVVAVMVGTAGRAVEENQLLTAVCQRTGPGLTVWRSDLA